MTLVDLLELARISLTDLDLRSVTPININDPMDVKGSIAHRLTEQWLSRCSGVVFDQDFPRRINGYSLERRGSGIVVYEHRTPIHEYDILLSHDGQPVIVEVKSLKLNGLEAKIPQALRIGRDIYQTQNVLMLVFFPFYTNKIADAERVQETHPEVRCVNLGYKKKHIWQAVQRFYSDIGLKQPNLTL